LTSNHIQKDLAHKFIDAGADLIIGSHPHVVQEVGLYKNKLIFYSLGNFIFDQYFSVDTQQGLMVGYDGSNYYLIPIQGNRSALSFMNNDKSKEFLRELAKRSVPELTNMIEGGKIKLIDN
jgi:poly-gamma-glutamate synthesis protein (capsule biosynthesis protein)